MTRFILPEEKLTAEELAKASKRWQRSSRINALVTGSSKSIGASCNTFDVGDNIYDDNRSISEANGWAYRVLANQGAPSFRLSALRPAGSPLGTGGTASGAVSFMYPLDSIAATMRREEKKNSAMLIGLDWNHPELDEFLNASFHAAYRAVYVPNDQDPDWLEFYQNDELLDKLAKAYDEFKCFIVKRPEDYNGEKRLVNLCTEIEIPHRGYCILGAVNLSQHPNPFELIDTFLGAAKSMENYRLEAEAAADFAGLGCDLSSNVQFGLGVYGLASWLGARGISYEDFNVALAQTLGYTVEKPASDPALLYAHCLNKAYQTTATWLKEHTNVIAAFCIQPTVSTAQRSIDFYGYNVSPEIQPVQGLRHKDAVTTIVKSQIRGDKEIHYHPNTATIDDIPYEVYAETSELWQEMMNNTGLAHRHSHCFWGKEFTREHLENWYNSSIRSLYYRLPYNVNTASMDKSSLWQEIGEKELGDFDVDALLSGGSCNLQMAGTQECECQN